MSSTDKQVTTDLIETLEDGRKGFAAAAEKLFDTDRSDLSVTFKELSAQRAQFSSELEGLAASYGDDIDESGSVMATVHRGWMAVKDAVSGSSPEGVLEAAEKGEEYAVKQFREALTQDISPRLRSVAERQLAEIQKAQTQVEMLRKAS